jgi:hypothetical protein
VRRALALTALLAGLWCVRVALRRPHEVAGVAPADGFTRVPGVVHVHTTLSDGGGTVEDVVAAAKAAGLRFVAITEHNTVDAKPFEGYRDGVLVIAGTELSTTAGHVLGLGIPDPAFRFSGDARDALADVRDLGGVAFATHTMSGREDFRWTGWDLPGAWGVEVLNGDSQWRAAGLPRLLRAAAAYPLNAPLALAGSWTDPTEELASWDRLLARRDAAGVAGADAHQRMAHGKRLVLPLPSYEALFRVARNHVLLERPLTGNAGEDTRAIVDALGRGRSYAGLDAIAPADGIAFAAEGGGTMGDTVAPRPGLRLTASGRMPEGARIRILKDGRTIAEGTEGALGVDATPGVYRAEIRLDGWGAPWVITNAIVIADEATAARRREAAAWPVEPATPAAEETLDAFEGSSFFASACDGASALRSPSLDPAGGVGGSGAGLLHFALGQPTARRPDVFCALVDGRARDLSGRNGLVFSIRGDDAWRIWVQVRDANPASTDEGTEWWFASVKTSAEWRRVALPFPRLRSINPKTDGRLDLDQVRAIVFVLDKGAAKPGSEGRIWIDDVGVF